VTRDRTYSSHEQYIFQMCDVESWTELWERAPKIEFVAAMMAEGIISEVALRKRMIEECVSGAENRREEIRRIAEEFGMTEASVRAYAYR